MDNKIPIEKRPCGKCGSVVLKEKLELEGAVHYGRRICAWFGAFHSWMKKPKATCGDGYAYDQD